MKIPPVSDPPIIAEEVWFHSGPYRLQGELAYPEAGAPRGAALLAGPHPLLGGTMENNVVRSLGPGLAHRGLATLRFNYRGAGRSEGPPIDVARHMALFWETSHVPDEMELRHDVQAAADFLRGATAADLPLALVGYSFGCALLAQVAVEGPCVRVLVAPTVGKHDYAPFESVKEPLLAIASEDDFAAGAAQVRNWFGRLPGPKELILERFDNHFFRGHEEWLADRVLRFLEEPRGRGRQAGPGRNDDGGNLA
jgi:alpha/beta superfamily hydrolase